MKRIGTLAVAALIFGSGYFCGNRHVAQPQIVSANTQQQKDTGVQISDESLKSYYGFRKSATDLEASLRGENLNVSATEDPNFFALSVGGIDAVRDLEEGRGVDPETFAAIYADRVTTDVRAALDTDADGRIRYKGTVIRMYSKDRLNELFNRRKQIEIKSSRVGG